MQFACFVHFFAIVLHDRNRNFLVYTFYGGNVGRVLVHFFFTVAHFHPGGRYKISFCSSNKNVSFCFFSLTLAPFNVELLWPVAYFLFFSVFLFLYIQNYFRQHGYRNSHLPLSVFVFIDSLVVSASQDAGGHTLSRQ